jgi:hypothetical protein
LKIKKDWRDMIEGVMVEFSVTIWEFVDCNHHPAVQFKSKADGTTRKIAFPGSSSDHRSLMNSRAEIRRHLKLHGFTKEK